MAILRNREFKRLALLCLAATAALTAVGAALGANFSLFALGVGLVFSALALLCYALHLRRIARLTRYMERVLQGDTPLQISRNREGEYSIFENQLYKLSSALRVQLDKSDEDRRMLANALADISHQIKTPLTAMGIECQLLREQDVSPAERVRLARDLDGQLRRIENLVTLLLKMSRLDAKTVSLHVESHPLPALLDRALAPLLIPLELRDITLTRQGAADAACPCDPAWTGEALSNIIKNAMEHTPPGGVIRIAWEETPLLSQITIENSGAPIPEKDLPHIFQRFYRGENAAENSVGIGLAFARQVIAQENGALTAQNTASGPRFIARFYKRVV